MAETARYRVLQRLGSGAAGGVYLVEDRALPGPPLALKRVEASSHPAFRDSLAREFAVLASLSVPRVARVYDLGYQPADGELPEGTYFTRSYVDGASLSSFAQGSSLAQRVEVFASTLRTVALLHRAGVVHGDIKPGNIIVAADGTPHLIDFGLAAQLGDASALGGSGTPAYMAPELLRGARPSVAGDLYALGATLWTLVAGSPPYDELGAATLSAKLSGQPPRPPAALTPDADKLLQVAAWALASEPRERAPSADELLARLEKEAGIPARAALDELAMAPLASPRTRGREQVLGRLFELASGDQDAQLALVTGASGMGKSTVLRELKWRLQLRRASVVELRCSQAGLEPFVQLLRQLSVTGAEPSLGELLRAVESGSLERAQLVHNVSDALLRVARRAPLTVIIDDLDRAEAVLCEVLRIALDAEQSARLSVIASAADAQQRALVETGVRELIPLAALSDADMGALADELLGPSEALAKSALLTRVHGNPGLLVEAAALLRERPGFSAADVEQLHVGAIGERLSRMRAAGLSEDARALLDVLALLAAPVPEPALHALFASALEPAMRELQQRGLLLREGSGVRAEERGFLAWVRAELGGPGARALAERVLDRAGHLLDVVTLAELAALGARPEGVAAHALPAALQLRKRGALAAAVRLLQASLSVPGASGESELRLELAELYAEMGDAAQALEQARQVLAVPAQAAEQRARAVICAAMSQVSIGKLEQAAQLLGDLPQEVSGAARARAARVLARLLLRRGDHDQVLRTVAEGVACAADDDASLPELLAIDAYVLALRGETGRAEPLYERALALAQRLGLRRDAAQVLGYRALGYEREGNLERAREEYERCLLAAREAGDVGLTATYALNQGNVSYRTGHLQRAEQSFELAARLSRRAGREITALLAWNNLADVYLYLGSYARAQQLAEQTLGEARELGAEVAEAQATHILANVGSRTGQLDKALSSYERAASLYRKLGRPREAAEALLDAADVLLGGKGSSHVSLASAQLAAARELIEQQRIDDFRPRLRLLVAQVRGRNGDLNEALAELEALESQIDKLRQRELHWQLAMAQSTVYQALGSDVLCSKKAREAAELLEAIATRIPRDARDAFYAEPRRKRVFELARSTNSERSSRTGLTSLQDSDPRIARLLELLKRLARERDEARLLERITDAAVELSGAERGFVLLVDERGQLAPHIVRAGQGVEQDPHIAFSRSIAEAVLIDGEPIITVNARDDARVNEFMSVHKLLLKSVACIPINGPRGVVGVLYLEHRLRAGRFRDADVDLLLAFADQAAIALENAALWADNERGKLALEERNQQLRAAKEDIERLLEARTEELEEAKQALHRARAELEVRYQRHGIIGQSAAMRRVFSMIERVADSNIPVVIQGESGTGKELVARAIHAAGTRRKGPFVAVNCAALPDTLLESELFGHVRGAFTGAERDRKGLFAQAHGGSLFLDEFADMSPRMQIDLLRVLQEAKICPVGSDEDVSIDVRVIAASQRPLHELVAEHVLREDLYYRLSVVEIKLPPLRERLEDIPLLCHHLLSRIAEQRGQRPLSLSRGALDRIVQTGLPGNVRQLEHLLTSAAMMAESSTIEPRDLPLEPRAAPQLHEQTPLVVESAPPAEQKPSELLPSDLHSFKEREKQRILAALDKHAWNRAKAASALGMPRRTFYRRLTEFGIL